MTRTAEEARSTRSSDEGFALITVLGSMVVITLFLLSSLAYALNSSGGSRDDQDAKAALAAAQAGIQEFTSRLSLDDTYYANNGGAHSANLAFTQEIPVLGSGGAAASYRYQLLTDSNTTGMTGAVRLKVVGCSTPMRTSATTADPTPCRNAGGVERELIALYRPDGFLRYIYFTDLEAADPALLYNWGIAEGTPSRTYEWIPDSNPNVGTALTFEADASLLYSACRRYYFAGRHQTQYVQGDYDRVYQKMRYEKRDGVFAWYPDGVPTRVDHTATTTTPIFFSCSEIAFPAGDVIDGLAHSNDSMQITGAVDFKQRVTSAWPSTAPVLDPGRTFLPPPTDGKLWWGDKSLTLPGKSPEQVQRIDMPLDNSELKAETTPSDPTALGCLYTGQTTIRFDGTAMYVKSPATTAVTGTPARCYNTSTPGVEQRINTIPPVIYVQGGACGPTTDIGFPKPGESTLASLPTVKYACGSGHAFVSGVLSGRVTIGTSHDVVVTGNVTYQSGTSGSDALGLIPQGAAWVYHPVTDSGSASCTPQPNCRFSNTAGVTPVRRIDAAILSVQGSFVVQNWKYGAALSTEGSEPSCLEANLSSGTCSKLTVRGSIIQKHRGPVGSAATSTLARAGYIKNYIYDKRLRNSPPPFFLQPSNSWRLDKVSD